MPTYSYACGKCGHVFDVFHSMSASPEVMCERCKKGPCVKQLGTGAGFIFKGSGFYETDYKDKKGTKEPAEPKSEPQSDSKPEPKAEPAAKPEPKTKAEPKAAKKSAAKPSTRAKKPAKE